MRVLRRRVFAAYLAATAVVLGGCASEPPADDTDQAAADADATDADDADGTDADDAADADAEDATDADGEPDEPDVPALHPEVDGWDAAVVTIATAGGGEVRVDVRVAATDQQRQRGLMHVEEVPDGAGMLFVYEAERTGAFWMKNTLVPLDIAFTGLDGDVRAVLTMEPCEADPCPTYDPEALFAMALEVPAGWFAANGVDVGDQLDVGPWVPAGPAG